jgi:AraC-like DNA-binding protein
MSSHEDTLAARLARARTRYREALPDAGDDWPWDMQAFYDALCRRLFDPTLQIGALQRELNVEHRRVSARMAFRTGRAPKAFCIHHRIELAKRLLRRFDAPIAHVALAVGYRRPSAFTKAFRRRVGLPPSAWRAHTRDA